MMRYSTIKYSKRGYIAALTLDRPEAGNAIDAVMAGEVGEACGLIGQDKDIYVVTLTGAGGIFCRGAEDAKGAETYHPAGAIAAIDRPVIAAVNGDALGPGLEPALACDLRIAAAGGRLGPPQGKVGALP